jgi:hypothetical protein
MAKQQDQRSSLRLSHVTGSKTKNRTDRELGRVLRCIGALKGFRVLFGPLMGVGENGRWFWQS